MTLYVHGLGHFHPENEITNRFLEELDIGTSDSWIVERVGIRSRRTVLSLDYIRTTRNADLFAAGEAAEYSNAELASRAAALAMERAGVAREQIGMLLCGSSVPDWLTPAEACPVAREIGLDVPSFDLHSACTSFLAGLHFLALMRPEALPDFVLVVAVDSITKVTPFDDRAAAVLWGDGAAAAVVSTRVPSGVRVIGTDLDSSPADADKVRVPRLGHFGQEGRPVQMFAIKKTVEGFEQLRSELGTEERPLHFVGHQANLRMLETVCSRCAIPPGRHHANVEFYGNTGCVGAPSVLSMSWEKWGPGDDVAVVGVGGGLTWARLLLRFDEVGALDG